MNHTDPPPSADPTPTRHPWRVMHDECTSSATRCLAWARAHLRVGQSPETLDRGLELARVGRELLACCEGLDALAFDARTTNEAFIQICDRAGKALEEASDRLQQVGVTG